MSADQNSYNKMGMFTFIASMAVSLGILVYVSFLSGGIDLKEVPDAPKAEQKAEAPAAPAAAADPAAPVATPEPAATPAPAAAEKKDGASNEKPWIPTAAAISRGAELFAQNCVSCHGKDGLGNGPAGENLSPRPRNLVDGQWKYGGTRLGLMQVLAKGSPGSAMQSYAYLAMNDRWSLVHYVRSITKNKISDNDADVALASSTLN